MFYSASTKGFYDPAIHGDSIQADAVEITAEQHAALLAAQSAGQVIMSDADGQPIAVDPDTLLTLDDFKTRKIKDLETAYQSAISQPAAYMGTTFQADPSSQALLAQAITAYTASGATPTGFYWLDAANQKIPMTLDQLNGLALVMADQAWTAFQNLQTKKTAAQNAATPGELSAITW